MWHSEHLGLAQGVRTHDGLSTSKLPRWGAEQVVITAVSWENLKFALVAQGIEHRFPKPCVAGSNPAGGTTRTCSKTAPHQA
jgi:hypothetical protein